MRTQCVAGIVSLVGATASYSKVIHLMKKTHAARARKDRAIMVIVRVAQMFVGSHLERVP